MAATSILSTDAEMNAMAGENVDATGWTDANKTAWGLQAECYLNVLSTFNYSDNFGTLNVDVKYILSEYVARYVGMCGILHNMAGYTSRSEAENMVNVHLFRMRQIENLLKEHNNSVWIDGA